MFEKEIKFISDFSLNKIKKLGSFFTFEKLLNSNIHPAILQYINAELDYLIYQDRNKLLQKSVFDYSGSEISKYFNLIGNEIKKNKKVSYEDIKKLLIQAVSFNINFTVRPKWSLIRLVYEGSEVKPVEEIKMILNYLYYYDYIKNVFNQYLSKKKIHSLSQVEFEVILNKIDKAVLSSQSDDIIDNVLFSIGDFHNIGGINKTKISLTSFELFLKEKNQIDQLLKLRKSFPSETKQKYDIEDIQAALYSFGTVDTQSEFAQDEIDEEEVESKPYNENYKNDDEDLEIVVVEENENEIDYNDEPKSKDLDLAENINDDEITETEVKTDIDDVVIDKSSDKVEDSENMISENEENIKTDDEDISENLEDDEKDENNIGQPEEYAEKDEEEIILDNDEEFKIDEDDLIIDEEIEEEINKELKDFNLEESADDILSKFDEELKSFEKDESEDDKKIDSDEDEVQFDISEKENLGSLYDFEDEENSNSGEETDEIQIETEENLEPEDDSRELENDNQIEDKIDDSAEIEKDDFETLEESHIDLEEKDKTDLYDQTEEFENEKQFDEDDASDINDDDEAENEEQAEKYNTDKDLFSFLSEREIDKIVSSIFNDDREDFANTMEKISECTSYDQSTDILKGLFLTYRVNPYSKEAVMLTNAVSNYFDQA